MLKRIPDVLVYAGVLFVLLSVALAQSPELDDPAPPPPGLGPLLPSETPRDERILVQIDAPRSGIGTAFAADAQGRWITARHVVDSCDDVALSLGSGQLLRITDTRIEAVSDLAVLRSDWRRKPLPTDLDSARQVGETGYFFGYPQGRPGEVVGRLLSRGRMQIRGRYATDEGVLIWTEVARTSGLGRSLGGLSGGPVLDADGEVIGVVAAETPAGGRGRRRGRIYSVTPRSLSAVLGSTDTVAVPIDLQNYPITADRLRRDRRVLQVVCLNDDS